MASCELFLYPIKKSMDKHAPDQGFSIREKKITEINLGEWSVSPSRKIGARNQQ